jgi:hypothetical protein
MQLYSHDKRTFTIGSVLDAPSVPMVVYDHCAFCCSQILHEGTSFRAVGRIAKDVEATASIGTFRFHVVADYIEIKPYTPK